MTPSRRESASTYSDGRHRDRKVRTVKYVTSSTPNVVRVKRRDCSAAFSFCCVVELSEDAPRDRSS